MSLPDSCRLRRIGRGSASVRSGYAVLALTALLSLGACSSGGLEPDKARDASRFNAELGANYLQRGNLELARDKLEKALEQDDNNALAHVTYAQLQQRIDRQREARSHFRRAIALEPDEPEHRNRYGIFLCEQQEFDAAEAQFLEASNNPFYDTPEFALDNAGICMLEAGRVDAAESYLRAALRENPQFANAYLHMAQLLLEQRRLTVADAYYQRFETYGTDSPESLLLGVRLKRANGETQAAEAFAERLLDEFPGSAEAGEYLAGPLD